MCVCVRAPICVRVCQPARAGSVKYDKSLCLGVISPYFSLEVTGFFTGKQSIYWCSKMKDFRNFVIDNCILVFDTEQVYLKLEATNLKN